MTAAATAKPAPGEHPAVAAWRRACPGGCDGPIEVETLQKRRKGRVYRLRGAAAGGGDLVAKWSTHERVGREALAYEVLGELPVSSLRVHGTLPDEEGSWLFVDDAGGDVYSHARRDHRALAGRWLAVLHTAAEELAPPTDLPDRTPDYYLAELEIGRAEVCAQLANPALARTDVALLEEVIVQCEAIARSWGEVERTCRLTPPTFVHGDFAPKNLHVSGHEDAAVLRPFDWASAGWGTPAPDLPQLDATPTDYWASPDLDAYRSAAEQAWPGLSGRDASALATVGKILRTLHCIRLEAPGLATDWPQASMRDMRYYHGDLRDALRETGWTA